MALMYKFPKIYEYVLKNHLAIDVPWMSNDEGLAEIFPFDILPKGALILDIACGTGRFDLWLAKQRPDLRIVGVDISEDMLAEANSKKQTQGLQNLSFLQKPLLSLEATDFSLEEGQLNGPPKPLNMVVCLYGFSTMKDYEAVFQHTFSLLGSGGTYLIMDLHYPKRSLSTILTTYLFDEPFFGCNLHRKPFLLMQEALEDFKMHEKVSRDLGFLPATYYIAKGTKK